MDAAAAASVSLQNHATKDGRNVEMSLIAHRPDFIDTISQWTFAEWTQAYFARFSFARALSLSISLPNLI
jgi:hypothetical protein